MANEYGALGTVFCMQCGKPNTAGARFCMFCGSELVTFSDPSPAVSYTGPEPESAPAEETKEDSYLENVFGDPVEDYTQPETESFREAAQPFEEPVNIFGDTSGEVPEMIPEPAYQPEPEAIPEPVYQSKPEEEPVPEEGTYQSAPEAVPEPVYQPGPEAEPAPEAAGQPAAGEEAAPEAVQEPAFRPEPEIVPQQAAAPQPYPQQPYPPYPQQPYPTMTGPVPAPQPELQSAPQQEEARKAPAPNYPRRADNAPPYKAPKAAKSGVPVKIEWNITPFSIASAAVTFLASVFALFLPVLKMDDTIYTIMSYLSPAGAFLGADGQAAYKLLEKPGHSFAGLPGIFGTLRKVADRNGVIGLTILQILTILGILLLVVLTAFTIFKILTAKEQDKLTDILMFVLAGFYVIMMIYELVIAGTLNHTVRDAISSYIGSISSPKVLHSRVFLMLLPVFVLAVAFAVRRILPAKLPGIMKDLKEKQAAKAAAQAAARAAQPQQPYRPAQPPYQQAAPQGQPQPAAPQQAPQSQPQVPQGQPQQAQPQAVQAQPQQIPPQMPVPPYGAQPGMQAPYGRPAYGMPPQMPYGAQPYRGGYPNAAPYGQLYYGMPMQRPVNGQPYPAAYAPYGQPYYQGMPVPGAPAASPGAQPYFGDMPMQSVPQGMTPVTPASAAPAEAAKETGEAVSEKDAESSAVEKANTEETGEETREA